MTSSAIVRHVCTTMVCLVLMVVAASAASSIGLSVFPNPALVGQGVSFTATVPPGTPIPRGQLLVDFGDGSARAVVQPNSPVTHLYNQSGSFAAQLILVSPLIPAGTTLARATVSINARGGGAAMQIVGMTLSWPNGASSLSLSGSSGPPQPVALVRVSGPGTLVVQWRLDGNPYSTATQTVSSAGNQRFVLSQPLPNSGSHSLSLVVIEPSMNAPGQPTPAPPLTYAYAGTPIVAQSTQGFYNGPTPVVKFPSLSFVFVEGKIDLQTPQYGIQGCPETCTNVGIPMLDDSVFFSWKEENPGLADYFELHVLNAAGAVIATEHLADATTYYTPDAEFLENVLKSLYAQRRLAQPRVLAEAAQRRATDVGLVVMKAKLSGLTGLQWEVRGYKQFSQHGSPSKTVEVEKSAQWPLGEPNNAGGLNNCPTSSGGIQDENLALQTSSTNRSNQFWLSFDTPAASPGTTNITNYIGDPVVVYGNVDLSGSPYLSKPTLVAEPNTPPNTLVATTQQVAFDNLFVDWGDGTVEPLRTVPAQNNTVQSYIQRKPNPMLLSLPVAADAAANINAGQFHDSDGVNVNMHRYASTGTFTIRIFQLSESDVQHMTPSEIGAYVDASAIAQSSGPYGHIVPMPLAKKNQPTVRGNRFIGMFNGNTPTPADATGRAYLLFCNSITIDEGVDPYAEGPLYLQNVEITDFPNHRIPAPNAAMAAGSVYGACSTCDDDVTATATLKFYGRGDAVATWSLDGLTLETQQIQGLSSPPRHGLGRNPTGGTPLSGYDSVSPSQTLSTKAGHHVVRVQVDVAPPAPSSPNLDLLVASGRIKTSALGGLKVGFLSPFRQSSKALPTVAYVGPAGTHAVSMQSGSVHTVVAPLHIVAVVTAAPGKSVASAPAFYDAQPANPKLPCKFEFATKQGTFEISGLQHNISKAGAGAWSGHGSILLRFQTGGNSAEEHPVRVDFHNWSVPDGLDVTSGQINVVSPPDAQNLHLTGVTAGVATLQGRTDGKPDYDMDMGLNIALSDQDLRVIASPPHPPTWSNLIATVDPAGDWVYKNAALPQMEIGHSQFFLTSNNVTFDFSKGVDLGHASLVLYTLGFAGTNGAVAVNGWAIDGEGLEGHLDQDVNYKATFQNGYVSIPHATVDVDKSQLSATYPNMTAHVPFINADLKGTATLVSSGNASFPLTSNPITQQFGQVTVKVDQLEFEAQQGLGWVVGCDGHFDFANGNNHFAHVDVPNMFFTFAGRAAFAGGTTSTDVSQGYASVFGNTPLQVQSAHLIAPTSGADELDVSFSVTVHLSSSQYMPAAKTQVNYRFYQQGSQYLVAPPTMDPFDEEVAFPAGQPASDSHVKPVLQQTSTGTQYVGDVDLGMVGGPPIHAQFLLGYQGGSDYWLFRADVGFPPPGIALVPGIMSLYQIGGGAGYHIHMQNPEDVKTATFDPNADLTLIAGLQLGSVDDGFTYYLNGNFTITVGNNPTVRMDYSAWFATGDHSGSPTIDGYFQWAGGNFDGGLEGKFSAPNPLNNLVYFEIPGPKYGSSQYAASLHFGSGDWHIYVGQKSGPRVQAYMLIAQADSFLMLSNHGVDVGGGEHMHLGVGDSSVVSAYIDFDGDIELAITPQPHIAGDFNESADCGACISGGCFDVSESVDVHAEAMPLDVDASATIGTPWPLPNITIHVHL